MSPAAAKNAMETLDYVVDAQHSMDNAYEVATCGLLPAGIEQQIQQQIRDAGKIIAEIKCQLTAAIAEGTMK